MKTLLACVLASLTILGAALAEPEPPTKLNSALVSGGAVVEFATGPNGSWVVYRADQEVDDRFELYSVPAEGGTVAKLNGPLAAGSVVQDLRISGDGTRVVYRVGPIADDRYDLFSVPIAGGGSIRLNDDETSVTASYQTTPDGAWVIYKAIRGIDWDPFCSRLFKIPIEGGVAADFTGCPYLGDPYPSDYFEISRDSRYLVYTQGIHGPYGANLFTRGIYESVGYYLDFDVGWNAFVISPDSQYVAYFRFMWPCLLIAPITNGSNLGLTNEPVHAFRFSPVPVGGLSRIVYVLNGDLVRVNFDGSDRFTLATDAYNGDDYLDFTPDGNRVVYMRYVAYRVNDLSSIETLGGTSVKLNGTLTAGGSVQSFRVGPNSQYVVYHADEETDDVFELYSAPVAGGDRSKLSGALPAGGEVLDDYRIAADGTSVIYRASQETAEVYELYEAPILGGDAAKLSGEMPPFGDVQSFGFTADRQRVVYLANPETLDVIELYSVPRVFPAPPDGDDDGVPDEEDACPGTDAGDVVDPTSGCSIAQLCPCADPDYFVCVRTTATDFAEQGLITRRERGAILSAAARSDCGE